MSSNATGAERHLEYRIVLPMDIEEFRVGYLWSVANRSKLETGGGEGVEIVVNEPYDPSDKEAKARGITLPGQYTHKIMHLASKVPAFIRLLAPKGSLEIHEKSWNAFPYCRTEYSNPDYMKENFHIIIESKYAPDRGTTDNIHNLSGDQLQRTIDNMDIANDLVSAQDYSPETDPCKVRSEKANRGPLPKDGDGTWKTKVEPVMCCYKFYNIKFDWWGLKTKVENVIVRAIRRLLVNLHRELVCWMDNYYGWTIEDVRQFEGQTKQDLEKSRYTGDVRGMKEK